MAAAGQLALTYFAQELAQLRILAGSPSLADLVTASAGRPHRLARSTVSDKLAAKSLPDWDFVIAFVTACAVHAAKVGITLPHDQTDLTRWDAAHWRMLSAIDTARATDRLAAAAQTEIAHRQRRASSTTPAPQASPPEASQTETDHSEADCTEADYTVPRQLPAAVAHFAGRATQLAILNDLLDQAASPAVLISVISGMAGVGKTTLAVHWAHQVADRFPDGQLHINLRGFDPDGSAVTSAAAVRRFLLALGVSPHRVPASPDAQAARYRSQLAGRRMLIVLDNARDAEHVRLLLPGAPGCLVLVTSRNQLSSLVTVEGAHPVTVGLPSQQEAHDMLARRLGRPRLAAEPAAVEQIITRCAQLPLALAIVAARAAAHPQFPLAALAQQLDASRNRLDGLTSGDAISDVRAVLSWSYYTLTAPAARLFRLLALHPGPDICAHAAASLAALGSTALGPDRAQPLLAELAGGHLIVEHAPGRYTMHDLLRSYAAEQTQASDSDQDRDGATRRVLDHYLHTAHTAAMLLDPHREPIELAPCQPGTTPQNPADYPQALAWFAAEHLVLLAAVRHAAEAGLDIIAWQLAWTLVDFLDRRGHWHDHITSGHIAVTAAQRLGDPAVLARAHRLLARGYTLLGRFDDSDTHLHHALDLHRDIADRLGQAHTHLNIAFAREQLARHDDALDHASQALALYRQTDHEVGQASALSAMATYHALLGDHHQALAYGEVALALHQKLGYAYGQAAAWDSLGNAHHHLGQHAMAIDCYQHTLQLVRDLGDHYLEANTLATMGDIHHAAGNQNAARVTWQQALNILDLLDHPQAEQVHAKLTELPAV